MKATILIGMVAFAGLLVLAPIGELAAQPPMQKPSKYSQRYQPRKPTLSPYLNYFRRDTGVLDNYNQFIVPRQRLQNTLNQQQNQLNRQGQGLQQMDKQIEQFQGFRDSLVSPTGHGATFRNYSHYFPQRGGR